jgi:hypothetical protein
MLLSYCRFAYTSQQVRRKPGREVVTFLLGKFTNRILFISHLTPGEKDPKNLSVYGPLCVSADGNWRVGLLGGGGGNLNNYCFGNSMLKNNKKIKKSSNKTFELTLW